jgi:catechol 2,3-dioxygenase-like lactoylglutathione lyase family enzyme
VQLQRISLVCDDLERVARFWLDTFGLEGWPGGDPYNPERQVLLIGDAAAPFLEYVRFPGQPGDRGSGDLRRLDLGVPPAVWERLLSGVGSGYIDPLPDGRMAVLEPHSGLLIVCRPGAATL